MKHPIGTALKLCACLALLVAAAALIAGKDNIRKFRHMRSI